MELVSRLSNEMFREPGGGRVSLLPIGFGVLVVIFGVMTILLDDSLSAALRLDLEFVLLGIAFVCMGAAEVVPVERRRLSGLLRITAVCVFGLFGGIFVMPGLLGAEGESLGVLLVYTVLFFMVVTLTWWACTSILTGREQ